MLQTRCCEICRSSDNLIQWSQSLFDKIPVFNIKNKPMLRYKFGSVYYELMGPYSSHVVSEKQPECFLYGFCMRRMIFSFCLRFRYFLLMFFFICKIEIQFTLNCECTRMF